MSASNFPKISISALIPDTETYPHDESSNVIFASTSIEPTDAKTLIATQTSAKTVRSATDTVVGIEEQG